MFSIGSDDPLSIKVRSFFFPSASDDWWWFSQNQTPKIQKLGHPLEFSNWTNWWNNPTSPNSRREWLLWRRLNLFVLRRTFFKQNFELTKGEGQKDSGLFKKLNWLKSNLPSKNFSDYLPNFVSVRIKKSFQCGQRGKCRRRSFGERWCSFWLGLMLQENLNRKYRWIFSTIKITFKWKRKMRMSWPICCWKVNANKSIICINYLGSSWWWSF